MRISKNMFLPLNREGFGTAFLLRLEGQTIGAHIKAAQ